MDAAVASLVLGYKLIPADDWEKYLADPDPWKVRQTTRWRTPRDTYYGPKPLTNGGQSGMQYPPLPHYSTSIGAAWEVFLSMPAEDDSQRDLALSRRGSSQWSIEYLGGYDHDRQISREDSAPMAVCRAALFLKAE